MIVASTTTTVLNVLGLADAYMTTAKLTVMDVAAITFLALLVSHVQSKVISETYSFSVICNFIVIIHHRFVKYGNYKEYLNFRCEPKRSQEMMDNPGDCSMM